MVSSNKGSEESLGSPNFEETKSSRDVRQVGGSESRISLISCANTSSLLKFGSLIVKVSLENLPCSESVSYVPPKEGTDKEVLGF